MYIKYGLRNLILNGFYDFRSLSKLLKHKKILLHKENHLQTILKAQYCTKYNETCVRYTDS